MQRLSLIIALLLLTTLTSHANAQHDPERNSVRLIAAEKFGAATKELGKQKKPDSETHFVRMLMALKQDSIDNAVKHAKASLDAGLPFGRLIAGPRDTLKGLYGTPEFQSWQQKHATLKLLHGPMLGSVTDSKASLWVRTAGASTISIQAKDAAGKVYSSKPVKSSSASDFTAVLKLNGLQADTHYEYSVSIDGVRVEAANTKFKTFPKRGTSASFKVGFGGGAGFVPKWEYMWNTIREQKPDAFLMLGDNVYIDDPTESITNRYCYYRRQSRPEWRQFIAGTSMFAIYDDHDFGMNDCVPGPDIESPPWKRTVWNTFRQNWVNPSYGGGEKQPGCWHDFMIGDVHFILVDGRYYRDRKGIPSMLGPVQKKWLFDTLKNSTGRFKVLASPVPWAVGIKPGSRDPWDGFPEEREEVFSFIEQQRIEGVFLVAADRHRTDLRFTKRPNGYDLWEFESSKLTNRHTHRVVKTEGLVWGYNEKCSFALMTFDTTQNDPVVQFDAITIDGEIVHTAKLRLSQLKFKAQ